MSLGAENIETLPIRESLRPRRDGQWLLPTIATGVYVGG
jgi:hypothetical protein